MKVVRCMVCAHSYLGERTPSNCPSCSVAGRYLVPATEWREITAENLSPVSRANVEKMLALEADNAELYRVACESATDPAFEAVFDALAEIKANQVAALATLLGVDVPKCAEAPSFVSVVEYLAAANKREKRITRLCRKAADEAEEPEIKQFFEAMGEAAAAHMSIANIGQ